MPLMLTFGAGSALLPAALYAAALTVLFMVVGSLRHGRIILLCIIGAASLVQLLLPGFGFFGSAFEACKAMALYFSDVPAAAPLFAGEMALTLGVTLAVVCYAFTSRSVGFMPAAMQSATACFDSSRGGSIMAVSPTKINSSSSAVVM